MRRLALALLLLALAGAWGQVTEDPLAALATREPAVVLQSTGHRLASLAPVDRLRLPDAFVAAAVAVGALPVAERAAWQERLGGAEGSPAQAFRVLLAIQNGDARELLWLRALLTADFGPLADRLDSLAGQRPQWPGVPHLATSLRLLAMVAAGDNRPVVLTHLSKLQAAPAASREVVVSGLTPVVAQVAADFGRRPAAPPAATPTPADRIAGAVVGLARQLRRALFERQLTDPLFASLVVELPGAAADHLRDAQGLLQAGFRELAAALGRRLVAASGNDVDLLLQAGGVLQATGHGDELARVLRDGAGGQPYPARRALRVAYYRWLLKSSYPTGLTRPAGPTPFDQERETVQAAAATGELEPVCALADLQFAASALHGPSAAGAAAEGYRRVVAGPSEPLLRWTAWLAWAALEPSAAWAMRDRVTSDSPLPPDELTEGVLLVGLAAGEAAAAAEWLAARPEGEGPGQAALAALAATLRAATGDLDGALNGLQTWQEEGRARQMTAALRQVGAGLARGGQAVPAELRGLAESALRKLVSAERRWLLTARFATAAVSSVRFGQWLTVLWADVMAQPAGQPTAATTTARDELTAACVAWLQGHPQDLAGVRGAVQVAATALGSPIREFALPAAEALATAALRLAHERRIPAAELRYPLSLLWQQLSAREASDAAARLRAVVAECYPELAPQG